MDFKEIAIMLVVVIVGVIIANYVSAKFLPTA